MVYDHGGPWLQRRCILGRWKLLVLYCCSRHLWFYDRGRLERVEISTHRVGIQILTLLSKKVFWNWSSWEWRLYYLLSKSKWFLHWHQDKICLQFQTGVGRPTWFLLQAKMLSNTFFLWLVDYAPEGSMFLISKCDFSPLFQAERSLLRHNKAFRFFNFLQGRKGERFNLDLPLVANVEHLIEADFTASELTHTDFYFLHSGLALTGMYM